MALSNEKPMDDHCVAGSLCAEHLHSLLLSSLVKPTPAWARLVRLSLSLKVPVPPNGVPRQSEFGSDTLGAPLHACQFANPPDDLRDRP